MGKGTTIRERITALEVTVEDNKVELNMKIDNNQKCLIDKIDRCHTAITNHLSHAVAEAEAAKKAKIDAETNSKNNRWMLIVALIVLVAPYVAYGFWEIIRHVFFGHSFFGFN